IAQRETGELGVPDDADDLIRVRVLGYVHAEVVSERIFVALEKAPDERFVHHGDWRRTFVVGIGERTAADDGDAKIVQVAGADAVPGRPGRFTHGRNRMASHDNQLAPVVGERVVKREPGRLDARQTGQTLFKGSI